jgi:GNAT superfamily N-acetyltransferase
VKVSSFLSVVKNTIMTSNDTNIRRYTSADIPALVDIAMQEIPKLPHYETIKVDATRVKFLLENSAKDESAYTVYVMTNGQGKIVGAIAAYCVTQLISWDKSTGDIFLFIDPEWRSLKRAVDLIAAYVNWARRRGATLIQATHTSGYRGKEMDALLRRKCGFEVVGTLYRIQNV